MTDHTPEQNEEIPPVEFVTMTDTRNSVIFVKGEGEGAKTRVFYDLDHLFLTYAQHIMAAGVVARLTGDAQAQAVNDGQTLMMEAIRQSIDPLRALADMQDSADSLAGIETLTTADLNFD
jgi:hypothetical protein